ncbi:MAG: PEP/pyruvate-binding domain-containing protein [Acidimicrobiia bacterium]|nr:PEP/pyruvate-binding domain-containing protein [Acidimicrobiia bacterium]
MQRLTGEVAGSVIGGKAHHVSWLIASGQRVPETWVIAAATPIGDVADAVGRELDPDGSYAVRSSANVEDGHLTSYAGQFHTELEVAGSDVLAACDRVRRSGASDRVVAYQDHIGATEPLEVSVMIQPMVPPAVSGVAFSRNPMTGLNEVVVEAIAGRGDRLVGEGETPERWIRRWGAWTERPDNGLLDEDVVARISKATTDMAAAYGSPVDLEWVWDGTDVWWVQLRPITGLEDISIYSNRISREVLPGLIKPLVWSVNVPMVNQAWVDLFTEAIGPNDIRAEDLASSFCYRAYFNMGTIGDIFELMGMPRDSLEVLLGLPAGDDKPSFKPTLGTMKLLPRMLSTMAQKSRYGNRVPAEVHSLRASYRGFADADLEAKSDSALLADVSALSEIGVRAAYANIVTPLLANIHNALLRRGLSRAGIDPELVDVGGTAHLVAFNPNIHLDALAADLAELDEAARDEIRQQGAAALPDPIRAEFEAFLEQFGHLSTSGNDFSVAPWRETPDAVVAMALDHVEVHGATARIPWHEVESELSAAQRPVLTRLRVRTQQFIEHRENVSSTYTYGYGLFRKYFLEVGRRLVERGLLVADEDVMYLYLDELRAALLGAPGDPPGELVEARRREMESLADVEMPEIIYGDDFVPAQNAAGSSTRRGIPTSRGHHRGTLRVVRDTADFGKVAAGDVIAIPFSDVGWTPLFVRAGAVIAEAGGMLSHSSIVAREYRIPCVVSVPGATRLPDGATVVVDGYAGTVEVEENRQ